MFISSHFMFRKHAYYLNPRLILLLLCQICAALVFTYRTVTLDRFVFSWPRASAVRTYSLTALLLCNYLQKPQNRQRIRFDPFDVIKAIMVATVFAKLVIPFASLV